MDYDGIMLMIEQEVRADIHGDLCGHERVAEHIAAHIKALNDKIESLMDDSKLLDCLRACGVDNWGGWDEAIDMYNDGE